MALDAIGLDRLLPDGAALICAVAKRLEVPQPDWPVRPGPRLWATDDIAQQAIFFEEFFDRTARFAKVIPFDSLKHPRWPRGAPESQGGRFAPADGADFPPLVEVQYGGDFHDQLVDYLVNLSRQGGGIAIKSVPLTTVSGLTCIADALIKPAGKPPFILEVKTGNELAKLLFGEISDADELQFFLPLSVVDADGLWQVTGRRAAAQEPLPDEFQDKFENEIFYMQVAKADAEVSDLRVDALMKLPPQIEAQIRTALETMDEARGNPAAGGPSASSSYMWNHQLMRRGIVNSSEAAIKFAKIPFEGQFSLDEEHLRKIRCKETSDLWRVNARAKGQSAELVFRRSNAQVLPLELRPGPL